MDRFQRQGITNLMFEIENFLTETKGLTISENKFDDFIDLIADLQDKFNIPENIYYSMIKHVKECMATNGTEIDAFDFDYDDSSCIKDDDEYDYDDSSC